jgi:hypothetical protein
MLKFPPALFGANQLVTIINEAINADGSPASSVLVLLYRENIFVDSCVTDAAGVYRFDNLPEGNYKVRIRFKDGSDPLYIDYTSSRSVLISPLSTSITTSATLSITSSGGSTIIGLSSSGSRYSFYAPPLITTDDGYVGRGLVSFTTGSLTGISTIASGTGSATTAITSTLSEPSRSDSASPFNSFSNQTYGSATGAPNGLALYNATNSFYTNLIPTYVDLYDKIFARLGPVPAPWSDPPGVDQNRSAWVKKYDLLFGNQTAGIADYPYGISFIIKCLAWYPAGYITIYGNSPDSINQLSRYDGFKQISYQYGEGVEGIAVYQIWNAVLIDLLSYCHRAGDWTTGTITGPLYAFDEFPVPNFGCGWHNSYADFAAIRAAANKRVTAYTKEKIGKLPIRNDLPANIKTALDFLGLAEALQGKIRYENNYSTYSALQRVADQRATTAINSARALYGENSKQFKDAKAQAMSELNAAKGYLASEFFIKPMLNLLSNINPIASAERGVIDYLRGVPTGTTKTDVLTLLSATVAAAINTYYQTAESPVLGILAAVALTASGFPRLGLSMALTTLMSTVGDRNARDGIPGDSPTKSIGDFIDQTRGTFTQPSWLDGTTYDTSNLFHRGSFETAGTRVSFSGGTYTETQIPAPEDEALPYVWDPATQKFTTNPYYAPSP